MELVPFDWQGTRVRTVLRDGAPWFVAEDVCRCLGLKKGRNSVALLDEDERMVANLNTLQDVGGIQPDPRRGNPNVTLITESGLYALIFRSRLPSARAFRRWVTGEVLPALRTRGEYALPGAVRPGPDAAGAPHRLLAGLAAAKRAAPVWRAHPLLAPDWVRAETLRRGIALVDYEDARALGLPARTAAAAAGVPVRTLRGWRRAAEAEGLHGLMPRPRGRPAFKDIPEDVWGRVWTALNRGANTSAAIRAGLAGAGPDAPSARTIRRRIKAVIALAQRAGGKVEPT